MLQRLTIRAKPLEVVEADIDVISIQKATMRVCGEEHTGPPTGK